jgi:hypothetical protein
MQPDLIDKVIDLTVPSHPVLPYMNIHRSPIKIDQADMGRMSHPKTHLRSNRMECNIKLPMVDRGMPRSQTVRIFLYSHPAWIHGPQYTSEILWHSIVTGVQGATGIPQTPDFS